MIGVLIVYFISSYLIYVDKIWNWQLALGDSEPSSRKELLRVFWWRFNPQEEKVNPQEEKMNLQEENMNLQEENMNLQEENAQTTEITKRPHPNSKPPLDGRNGSSNILLLPGRILNISSFFLKLVNLLSPGRNFKRFLINFKLYSGLTLVQQKARILTL